MEAAEAKIQRVLERGQQFLVPHYQRPYTWTEEQWHVLWHDLEELLDDPDAEPHFLGSIVTSPARTKPEGIEKRLLIDGQQRLTTLLVLLTLIRDRARDMGSVRLADRIGDLITNRHEDGNDHYKLLPTQGDNLQESDRGAFIRLIHAEPTAASKVGISGAYTFFADRMRRRGETDLESLFRAVTSRLTLVSIVLDDKDNPHRIFESLNGKGRPLSQVDLIRNFFFMRLHERDHERVYQDLWSPMQRQLGEDSLTDFVRHYLIRTGRFIRETDVYAELKKSVDDEPGTQPLDHLKQLTRFAGYYQILLRPESAPTPPLKLRLGRLNRLEVTVAYPFLLNIYADYTRGDLSEAAFCEVLDSLENYLIRRFVCGVPTHGLNKTFVPLYEQVRRGGDFVASLRQILSASSRLYPRDDRFIESLRSARLYGGGERREKTKFLLERVEAALGHKEPAATKSLTIEHVMPQALTPAWKESLGERWEEAHEDLLHTLGNLTLTGYNPEMSNGSFAEKRRLYVRSHIEMNRYFEKIERWGAEQIEDRAAALSEIALSIWPSLISADEDEAALPSGDRVTGTVPRAIRVQGHEIAAQSWAEVGIGTVEAILAIGEEEFERVAAALPKFVNRDATALRRSSKTRRLSNGAYVETNLSATAVYRLCLQALQAAGLGTQEWVVELAQDTAAPPMPSARRQMQLELWTEVRAALAETGRFPSLRPARARYWFNIALGRSHIGMDLTANTEDHVVGVKIYFNGPEVAEVLDQLQTHRDEIEREAGAQLEWNPYPDKKEKIIRLTRGVDLTDRAAWPEAIQWLVQTAIRFRDTFGPRIQRATTRAS